jgi:hypothetical protein
LRGKRFSRVNRRCSIVSNGSAPSRPERTAAIRRSRLIPINLGA